MLTEDILNYSSLVSFHTPSHSGKLGAETLLCDVTELFYSDNLLSPQNQISDLEKSIASVYDAEACFISAQGATHNVFQAVFATKSKGAFLIIGKAHASVYNALRFFGAKTFHSDMFNDIPDGTGTVILTSPDYFGKVLPLYEIVSVCHEKGITVIIDASHGSAFAFSDILPDSATLYGDLVIHSLHKTLPVITGGSVLLCKNEYKDAASLCRKTLHTTSPNYMVMCSIERGIRDFKENGERYFEDIKVEIDRFREGLKNPFRIAEADDFSRLVIESPYDGKCLYNALVKSGYCGEFYYENKVVFIVNPYNYMHLKGVCEAVNAVRDLPLYERVVFPQKAHPKPALIRFGESFEKISLSSSEGRAVYNEIGFYPPGVPLLYSGDLIEREHIEILREKSKFGETFGLDNGYVFVLK